MPHGSICQLSAEGRAPQTVRTIALRRPQADGLQVHARHAPVDGSVGCACACIIYHVLTWTFC